MFKFFLSRYKSIVQKKKFLWPAKNAAEIVPVLSSYLTNRWPKWGRKVTDGVIKFVYGNKLLLNIVVQRQKKVVKQGDAQFILVISDLNIGDALNLQVACQTLRQLFPENKIHYAINKKSFPLIKGNTDIDEVLPVFSGKAIPDKEDIKSLKNQVQKQNYDLIINFCPFFVAEMFSGSNARFLNHFALTMDIAYTELRTQEINHLRKKIFDYLVRVFPDEAQQKKPVLKDVPVFISQHSIDEAGAFFNQNGLSGAHGIIMFNPDATSQFTKFPLQQQISLLKRLVADENVSHVLLGSGFVFKGIEKELVTGLKNCKNKEKIVVLPNHFSLETYAALIDLSDVYITNDTGPLHLAATRKYNDRSQLLRNKTAIYSIFGATPSRIYAYDSENPAYFPAPQQAPSHVFVAQNDCRNITCINKLSKKCNTIRCFDNLNPDEIADTIISYLKEYICI